MKRWIKYFGLMIIFLATQCAQQYAITNQTGPDNLRYPQEKHLKNVTQLTFGGNNAEAYWSFDSKQLTFQSDYSPWTNGCDQIFRMTPGKSDLKNNKPIRISTGTGRTTCSYFMPGNKQILYASTHAAGEACPPAPERNPNGKYVWAIYESFDIYISDLDGKIIKRLTDTPGYDAEGTISPKGDKIVFTSVRDGDLDLYTVDIDGKNVKRITYDLGYDGGAFFSPDGTKLVFRASRPKTDEAKKEYLELLHQGLVQPVEMDLYTIKDDGTGLEKITYDQTFDSFPMFSPNGKYLVFASNRFNGGTRDTNLFVAEWVD